MDPLLFAAFMGLGTGAFAYLMRQVSRLEARVDYQEKRAGRIERAYSRLRQAYIRQKAEKIRLEESNADLRQRLTIAVGNKWEPRAPGKDSAA